MAAVVSRHPYVPGSVWNRFNYVSGLRALGHEVFFVEEVGSGWRVDASGQACDFDRSINRRHFAYTVREFGLDGRACQLHEGDDRTEGLARKDIEAVCNRADLLLNFSGHAKSDLVMAGVRRRAYIDQDPVYTQLWQAEYGADLGFARHDVFFSVGLNIGSPRSPIPSCGLRWHPQLPPVDLKRWPMRPIAGTPTFTSVASLGGYRDLCYRGVQYSSKHAEFERLAALPLRASLPFQIAVRPDAFPRSLIDDMRQGGWRISDAARLSDLDAYQQFIACSGAEICVAKGAYVHSHSGWLSDRSGHYLASGKPVLAQATGFEEVLPVGEGLIPFEGIDGAIAGAQAIASDYPKHCRAARDFAEKHLAAPRVMAGLIKKACA